MVPYGGGSNATSQTANILPVLMELHQPLPVSSGIPQGSGELQKCAMGHPLH